MNLFGDRKPVRRPVMGDPDLERWENHPKRKEYRAANDGMGMCNTGSGQRIWCILGGMGCNVDHATIARENLKAKCGS